MVMRGFSCEMSWAPSCEFGSLACSPRGPLRELVNTDGPCPVLACRLGLESCAAVCSPWAAVWITLCPDCCDWAETLWAWADWMSICSMNWGTYLGRTLVRCLTEVPPALCGIQGLRSCISLPFAQNSHFHIFHFISLQHNGLICLIVASYIASYIAVCVLKIIV
jgi:hypothetical protein